MLCQDFTNPNSMPSLLAWRGPKTEHRISVFGFDIPVLKLGSGKLKGHTALKEQQDPQEEVGKIS